ncbi:uncharacterized protein VP01_12020g2, partial [Puccinia sorghi]
LLDTSMDRLILHVVKSSIALDVRPIVKEADSALEAFQTLKKNFHKSTRAKQLELINELLHLDNNLSVVHFNKFFAIISQLSSLGMNNLILTAAEKSGELGTRDIQVIYNLVQSDSVEGMGTEANPFKINWVGYNGRGGGVGGSGRGLGMTG